MIRSGLTNVKKAGYSGYPHERDPNPRNTMERPFVSLGDTTVLNKSDFSDPLANSTITPKPIMYNDIFAKRTTADERLYILKQIQQGLNKIQKGFLGKEVEQVPSIPLPAQSGQIIPTPPFGTTRPSGGPSGEISTQIPDLISPSTDGSSADIFYDTNDGVGLAEQELAQEVVESPPERISASADEQATNEWLHMPHDPRWAQIEGRTFNTSPWLGPDSAGSYRPQRIYPDLAATPSTASPQRIYPSLTATPSTASSRDDGHSFAGATPRSPEPVEQTQINYLNHIFDQITGLSYDEQYELFSNVDQDVREAIGQVVVAHPNHPVTLEPIFRNQIALFSPGTRSATTPANISGQMIGLATLDIGTARTASPVTPSPSVASTISSNGVGPRSRQSPRSSSDMSVDQPRARYRQNPPPPINTQAPPARRRRPRVLADLDIDHGLRPQRRVNYAESPVSA